MRSSTLSPRTKVVFNNASQARWVPGMEVHTARPLFKTIGLVFGLFLSSYNLCFGRSSLRTRARGPIHPTARGKPCVGHRRECPPFRHELLRSDCGIAYWSKGVGRSCRKLAICPSYCVSRCILRCDSRCVRRQKNDLGSSCGQFVRPRRVMGRMEWS